MDVRRREFLLQAALITASSHFFGCAGQEAPPPRVAGGPGDAPAPAKAGPKKVLILGGTKFLGPQLVDASRAHGHTVTLFNRGKTNPQLFPDVEKLAGAYGFTGRTVEKPHELSAALREAIDDPGPYLLNVKVAPQENVYPMVPAGSAISEMVLAPPQPVPMPK